MADIIPIKTIQSPAIAAAFGYQESDLTEGAALGFPVLTYRGKVWRVTHKGEAHPLLTIDKDPIPAVRVIILKANPHLSKIYYEKSYTEGDNAAPDCFSMDGDKPDPSIKDPQSLACASCPKAAWGSRMSDDGKELKACQDSRRIVVVPASDVSNTAFGGPMLLRVPAASLGNLVAYDSMLKKANAAYFGVATKISFDTEAAYPKLVFEYDGPSTEQLTEVDGQSILELRNSPETERILEKQSQQEHADGTDANTPAKSAEAKAAPAPVVKPPPVVEVEENEPKTVAEEPSPSPVAAGEVEEPNPADVDSLVDGLLG